MARLKITQVRSRIGATERQCRNLDALGLKKIDAHVEHDDSPIIRGMLERVKHLVKIEEIAGTKVEKKPSAPKAVEVGQSEAVVAEEAPKTADEKPAATKPAAEKKPAAAKKPAAEKKPAAARKPAAKKPAKAE